MLQTRILPTTNADQSQVLPAGRGSRQAAVANYELESNRTASEIEEIAMLEAALK